MHKTADERRPSPDEQKKFDLLLWLALMFAPLAVGINTIVGYTVAHWVCDANQKWTAFLVSAFDFLLCISAFLLAFNLSRRVEDADESLPEAGRRRFMAKLGLLLSGFAVLVVIAGTIALVTLHPCD
jgi:hypothetical protein